MVYCFPACEEGGVGIGHHEIGLRETGQFLLTAGYSILARGARQDNCQYERLVGFTLWRS